MEFSREDLKAICFEDIDPEIYEIIEDNGWQDEGKYSYKDVIIKHKDKFYSITFDRSGSYYSHYEYDFDYMDTNWPEVEKKEVTVTKWVAVKPTIEV